MFHKQQFGLPAFNLQEEEQSKTVCLTHPKLPKEIKELVDKGNMEQITIREFREEQMKSYIVKFKEDDDEDKYDTYELFHYYLAENKRKRQSPQKLNSNVGNNPFDKSFETLHAQKND